MGRRRKGRRWQRIRGLCVIRVSTKYQVTSEWCRVDTRVRMCVCRTAGAFSRIAPWTQQESDARSLKFRHGVTLVWREPIVGVPGAGTEWQPCQRLWRPSFHLAMYLLLYQRSILDPVALALRSAIHPCL